MSTPSPPWDSGHHPLEVPESHTSAAYPSLSVGTDSRLSCPCLQAAWIWVTAEHFHSSWENWCAHLDDLDWAVILGHFQKCLIILHNGLASRSTCGWFLAFAWKRRRIWNEQENAYGWCWKVSWVLCMQPEKDSSKLQHIMWTQTKILLGSRHRKAPTKTNIWSVLFYFFFHFLCDFPAVKMGNTILKLNLRFCSKFCIRITQACVTYNFNNIQEVHIAFSVL